MGMQKIGSKIVIEGEQEYRRALKEISNAQKENRSEMKLWSVEYKNNQNSTEALAKKKELLTKQLEVQSRKVEACTEVIKKNENAEAKAAERVAKLRTEYDDAEKALEEMKNTTGASSEEMEAQSALLEELSGKLSQAESDYDKTTKKVSEYRTSLNYATAGQKSMENELSITEGYLQEAKEATDGCATSIDRYGKEVKQTKAELQDAGGAAENFGDKSKAALEGMASALAAAGIAKGIKEIAESLKECIDAAAVFETAIAKLSTIADESVLPIGEMRGEILELSNKTGKAAADIAETAYNAISAGVKTEEAVSTAGKAAQLATAGFTDAGSALDLLTTIMNSYGKESLSAAEISDMLIATQNNGKTTIAELSANMGEAVGLGATYKISLDDICTAMANVTMRGETTATAGTKLKGMFSELGDAGSGVGKILAEKTGKSFVELMKDGMNLGSVLQIISDTADEQNVTMDQLFSSTEAGIGAIKSLAGSSEKYNDVLKKMESSTGATEEAFAKMADTTELAETKMKNASLNLKIAIGETLRPAMEKLYQSGENVLNICTEFVEEHPEVVQALTALAAGVGVFAGSVAALLAIIKAYALIAGMALNPTILLVGALAALATAAVAYTALQEKETSAIEQCNEKTKELVQSSKELKETTETSAQKRAEEIQSMDTQAATCKNLVAQLKELQSKTKLTAEDQSRQKMIIDQLNQIMPDLNLYIDEQTGLLNMSTKELEDNIEMSMKYMKVQAAREQLAEIATEQFEIEQKLWELEEQRIEQETRVNEANQERLKWQLKGIGGDYESARSRREANKAYEEAVTQQEALEVEIKSCTESSEQLSAKYQETLNYIGEHEQIDETTAAVDEFGNAAATAGENIAQTAQTAREKYAEMCTSLTETIGSSISLFGEFNGAATLSTQELLNNMQSQIDGITNWADNLQALADRGISQGLLKKLSDMGPEGAGYVATFVQMTDEELEKANGLFEESLAIPEESAEKIADAYREAGIMSGEGFKSGIEEKYEETDKAAKELGSNTIKSIKNELKIQSPSKVTTEIGQYTAQGLALGMNKERSNTTLMASNLAAAVVAATKKGLQTSIFEEIGKQITSGMVNGIEAGKSDVINSIMELCEASIATAKKALEINSPSKKFEYFGEMSGEGYISGWKSSMADINGVIKRTMPEMEGTQPRSNENAWSRQETIENRKQYINQEIKIYAQENNLIEMNRQFKQSMKEAAAAW